MLAVLMLAVLALAVLALRLDHRGQGRGPYRGPLGRRADQRAEQPRILPLFRVPLDAEHEAGQAAHLRGAGRDRLDQSVFLPRDRPQPVAEQVDGLVVMGGYLEEPGLGQDAGQYAVRADLDVVPPEPA